MKHRNFYHSVVKKIRTELVMKSTIWSAIVGITAGTTVSLYRLAIVKVETLRTFLASGYGVLSWMALTVLVTFVLRRIVTKASFVSGSGIPQVKMLLSGKIDYDPLKALFYKFLGGILAIFNGFSLGREGPSIQIGSAVGQWLYRVSPTKGANKGLYITLGSCAGLAAAFNAPFAGIVFVIEELKMNLSPSNVVNCILASFIADLVSKLIFGAGPIFRVQFREALPLNLFPLVVLLGVIAGLAGWIFEKSLLRCVNMSKNLKYPSVVIPTVLAWILFFTLPLVLSGGHELVMHALTGSESLKILFSLLLFKFLFTLSSYSSKAPGGIFLPMVSMGALLGAISTKLFAPLGAAYDSYSTDFAVLGVSAFLTAVVRAPVTSIVLTAELFGCFTHLFFIVLASIVSYLVSGLLKTKPVYDALMENMLANTQRVTSSIVFRKAESEEL